MCRYTPADNVKLRYTMMRNVTLRHAGRVIMWLIPPVASTAGEGGKPPGGRHLRVSPVYLLTAPARGVPG